MSQEQGSELEALKYQVNRLTEFLAHYQKVFSDFTFEEGAPFREEESHQNGLLNSSQIHPLLKEYDAVIFGQKEHITVLENELERLKNQIKDMVQENERLHQELKDLVQSGMLSGPIAGGGDGEEILLIQNLQQQIDLAIQEKETAEERWRNAIEEVDRLEAALEIEKESHQWRVVEQQAHQVRAQYQESVTTLNSELHMLHEELRESRAENNELMQKASEMKVTINELQQQLIMKAQENADAILKEGMSDNKVYELKKIMDDLRLRLSDITHEVGILRVENNSLATKVIDLQSKLNEAELHENEAVIQVRNAVHMAEAAALEKDQCDILAKKKGEELEEMKEILAKVINKAGERTREEVDSVKKQFNERIIQLTEELQTLEMEGAEKQSRLDRLLREKRGVESELQQFFKEGAAEGSKYKEAYHQLIKRAVDAERAKDEAFLKIDSLQSQLDKLVHENLKLKQLMQSQTKHLQDRLIQLQSEFETVNEDRLSSINKQNELNKKLQAALQEKDEVHRKFNKQLALIEQDQQIKTRDLEIQLQTTEDTRRETINELRKILTAQQRMSIRWKEECQSITHKFEVKLQDLQSELSHAKKRNEELTSLLKDSQTKTVQAEKLLSDYTKHIRRLEERVIETEMQIADAAKHFTQQKKREKLFMTEINQRQGKEQIILEDYLSCSQPKSEGTLEQLST